MKAFNGYDEAKKEAQVSVSAKLPVGAYICKVQEVKLEEFDWGSRLVVTFDVAEGEYKGFFGKQFEENTSEDKRWKGKVPIYVPKDDGSDKDKITKRSFASWIDAFEKSNKGYEWDWDETKLKNKIVGIVFGETGTNIEGKDVVFTNTARRRLAQSGPRMGSRKGDRGPRHRRRQRTRLLGGHLGMVRRRHRFLAGRGSRTVHFQCRLRRRPAL